METLCRVISLPEDISRRRVFQSDFERSETDVKWGFFDAHRSPQGNLDYDSNLAIIRRGRELSRSELGCYSSHYGVWVEFLQSSADQLLVLEDDVLVDWRFIGRLLNYDLARNGIHFLRLSSKTIPPTKVLGELMGRYLVLFLGYALGAQAYMLTRPGAKTFLRTCRTAFLPVDDMMDKAWRGGLPNFGVYHHPVMERDSPSRIGEERHTDIKMSRRQKFERLRYRIEDKIHSRRYRIQMRWRYPAYKS